MLKGVLMERPPTQTKTLKKQRLRVLLHMLSACALNSAAEAKQNVVQAARVKLLFWADVVGLLSLSILQGVSDGSSLFPFKPYAAPDLSTNAVRQQP